MTDYLFKALQNSGITLDELLVDSVRHNLGRKSIGAYQFFKELPRFFSLIDRNKRVAILGSMEQFLRIESSKGNDEVLIKKSFDECHEIECRLERSIELDKMIGEFYE